MRTRQGGPDMIRSLLLAAGFLVVTITLLFLQPSPRDGLGSDDTFAPLPVTRADVTPSDPLIEAPVRARTDRAITAPVQPAERETFGANHAEALSPSDKSGGLWSVVRSPSDPDPVPAPVPAQSDNAVQNQIAMMTQNILRELGSGQTMPQPAASAPSTPRPAPATAPIIAPVSAPVEPTTATTPVPATPVNAAFRDQLIAADTAGATDLDLETMLRDAVAAGQISTTAEYKTALGDVDYTALLSALLPSRLGAQSVAVDKEFMYRVQPNDSLAGLSALFYGDVKDYARILAANPETLSNASDVSPGMLLKIPGT